MLHRLAAFTVALLVLGIIFWLLRNSSARMVKKYSQGLGILVVMQFGLGISNVLLRLPMWSRVLHLTVAAAIWAVVVMLWAFVASARPQ
jgi:cytochrome c oxidase assembly protein subunit 15